MKIENAHLIYQHMGLGDHVICNGLVRNIITPESDYIMFVKPHNLGSVSYMYRDLANLKFVECDDTGAMNWINRLRFTNRLHMIGFNWIDTTKSFEENFYLQHGISLDEKWKSFRCDRDLELEQKVYDHFKISEPYVFVHDDNRFQLDPARLPKDTRIIRPEIGLTDTIFAYATLVERAQEVHCIESSFAFIVDLMKLHASFYIHRYARPLKGYDVVDLFGKYANVKEILT